MVLILMMCTIMIISTEGFTDGIGTPDPNSKHLGTWWFQYSLVDNTCF